MMHRLFTIPLIAITSVSAKGAITESEYLSGTGADNQVDWEFFCTGGRNSGAWTKIPVPSCWELEGFGTYNYGHDSSPAGEQGRYRHRFVVPEDWSGRRVDMIFEGVMTDCEVWVNGTLAGPLHQGGFTQFRYEVSSLLNFGAANLLEVTVSKRSANRSINAAEREADYWIFGGIYRPVRLEARPGESIQRVALDPQADGTLSGRVFLNDIGASANLNIQVRSTDGSWSHDLASVPVSSGANEVAFSGMVPGIDAWTMENPVLYDVVLSLSRSGQPLHTETERTGFRTIEVRPQDGIYLNGVKIRLKGVSRHTFWPDSGRTVSRTISEEAVALIKSMNMNTVRATSYPADKHFLETCDAAGLLVIAELPGWQDPYDDATAERMVREMVERDVNHPSIIFWNNGNEGGWNPSVEDDYELYDPQARPVVRPGSNHHAGGVKVSGAVVFNGLETTHYPTWSTLQSRLAAKDLYLPTEILHGLYDGGHGAGLEDYWQAIRTSAVGAGMILWVLADEGVVRTDLGGTIDTDGNHAPDGIVGPYGEPEPSMDAIRNLWSPVVVTADPIFDTSFDASIELLNDSHFTNLDTVRFDWKLIDFPKLDQGSVNEELVRHFGSLMGPDLAPQSTGSLTLPLPAEREDYDALRLEAFDAKGRPIRSWTWRIRSRTEVLQANLPVDTADAVTISDGGSDWILTSGSIEVRIGKTSGRMSELRSRGVASGLSNGPRLVAGSASLSSIRARMEGLDGVVEATFSGNLPALVYRMSPGGVMEINYTMMLSGSYANIGLTFDLDTSMVTGLRWLGGGHQPVWKNRTAGAELGVWEKARNSVVPGEDWTFGPVFRGHHANLHWATLQSTGPQLNFLTDTPDIFLRVLTPSPGSDPAQATFTMPPGDLSLLHGISGVGNKFMSALETGPSGALNTVSGSLTGRFFVVVGDVDPRPQLKSAEYVNPYRVRVGYDRSMDAGALNPSAYELSPARAVHAVIQESAGSFLLDIEPLKAGSSFTLTIDSLLATSGGEALREPRSFQIDAPVDPLLYFSFDEESASSSPNEGTAGGSATIRRATLADAYLHAGLHLTGSTSGASFDSPSLTRFTASAWVKLEEEVLGTFPRILSLGADSVQWALDISSPDFPRSIAFNAAGLGDWRSAANVLPAAGSWMHLAVAFDSSSGLEPCLYLNGAKLEVTRKGSSAGNYSPSGLSGIGNRATDWARVLPGWIDEFRIEDRILSDAEVAALAVVPPTRTFAMFMADWPELDQSPIADPDLDGLPSILEFVSGTDPSIPNAIPPSIERTTDGVSYTFSVSATATGHRLVPEQNSILDEAGWASIPNSGIGAIRSFGGVIQYRLNWSLQTAPQKFFRLSIP